MEYVKTRRGGQRIGPGPLSARDEGIAARSHHHESANRVPSNAQKKPAAILKEFAPDIPHGCRIATGNDDCRRD
jgi:hypothetical protein